MTPETKRPVFELSIYINPQQVALCEKYKTAIENHNQSVLPCIIGNGNGDGDGIGNQYFNAGFDLFCPYEILIGHKKTEKINHYVICSMRRFECGSGLSKGGEGGEGGLIDIKNSSHPVSYYMYPRSSTGTKTPLRLANSVGIIDSGYRGNIIAAFDNVDNDTDITYGVETYQRLVQLCPPDISHPMYVRLVDDIKLLGETARGDGGFGSTGR
jgi:dUTP pyrophosphatase